MWRCPVCGKENEGNTICFDCGWNGAKDYLIHATVCPIGNAEKDMLSESLYGTGYLMKRAEELQKKERWSEALFFYEKAAEKGNPEAMKYLGRCFREGLGTKKNLYMALHWYCKIMGDEKEDVSLLIDDIYQEIKDGQAKKEDRVTVQPAELLQNRTFGEDKKESVVSDKGSQYIFSNFFSVIGKVENQIQNIFFEKSLPLDDPSVKTYAISPDGAVRYWLKRDENSDGSGACDLYIGAEGGIDAPESCRDLFAGYIHVQRIAFQNNFRTQDVKDMSRMFYDCRNLQTLDISSFDTGNVTDMSQMFGGCERLVMLNLGKLHTQNVQKMTGIFENCNQLEHVFYYGTGAIKQIKKEYETSGNCRSTFADHVLKKVNPVLEDPSSVSGISWENSGKREPVFKKNVLNKNYFSALESKIRKEQIHNIIFENELPRNSSVQTYAVSPDGSVRLWLGTSETWLSRIDLYIGAEGGVDAPEDCDGLFYGFSNMKSIVFQNNFRTRNVKKMSYMFYGCSSLQELDVSGFDCEQVTDMSKMFQYCAQLERIDLRRLNTSNVKDMSWMFDNCTRLKTLDFSGFDTKNVKDMSYLFGSCENLMKLDLSRFDTQNVMTMRSMFQGCKSLKILNLSNFDTRDVEDMSFMFDGCSQLDTYLGGRLDTGNADSKKGMFRGCRADIRKAILGN